jgi:hypothetical protein
MANEGEGEGGGEGEEQGPQVPPGKRKDLRVA